MGHGRWTFWEAIYSALLAASTVGFAEPTGLHETPYGRALMAGIIIASVGVLAYFQSNLTTFFVEDVFGQTFRIRRMMKQIENVRGHVIVAGGGSTGRHVIRELISTKTRFVVIDHSREQLEQISEELADGKMLYVVGDATIDQTLIAAGVQRAEGVVTTLTEDRDNLYVTLSARTLNPSARIVAKVISPDAVKKMMRAGATSAAFV